MKSGPCFTHASLRFDPMPSRTIEESHRPRVSNRTMHCHSIEWTIIGLVCFGKTIGAVTNSEMEPQRRRIDSLLRTQGHTRTLGPEEDHSHSGRPVGWAECREKKIDIEPTGRFFLLTFPLIGLYREKHCALPRNGRSLAQLR